MNLEFLHVEAGYPGHPVLTDVSFSAGHGRVTTLLGPNGCGKTTLLRCASRQIRPVSGDILLGEKSISSFSLREISVKTAFLTQKYGIVPGLTVRELVSFGRFPHRRFWGGFSTTDRTAVENAMRCTGTFHLKDRTLDTLSGGEIQRSRLAMTLAQEPELLVLDEPVTALDIRYALEITELIRRLNREQNLTVLMVLHDLNLASLCSDKLVLLKSGKVFLEGAPDDIITEENLHEVFGVEEEIIRSRDGFPCCLPRKRQQSSTDA